MAELVYALVLGTNTEGCKGSSPFLPTKKTKMVDTPVSGFFEFRVYKGIKINEVGCSSICNRAYEVAIDKKLLAVGLRSNRNTILRTDIERCEGLSPFSRTM